MVTPSTLERVEVTSWMKKLEWLCDSSRRLMWLIPAQLITMSFSSTQLMFKWVGYGRMRQSYVLLINESDFDSWVKLIYYLWTVSRPETRFWYLLCQNVWVCVWQDLCVYCAKMCACVRVCVCVCMFVCVILCVLTRVYVSVCVRVAFVADHKDARNLHIHTYIYMYLSLSLSLSLSLCVYVCVYVYIYICIRIHTYICIHTYIQIHMCIIIHTYVYSCKYSYGITCDFVVESYNQ